ncbi:DDE-type integrase/transposase/recombinase [Sphingomonas sp. CCH15-F11]|uniref:DDE-type integrase/transposase/recombinase n=1 Tax=Sphingomonas sp. CCH15-F11 TaxID=1768785 RepID=UPI000829BBB2|nr:Mu transposase C-terminal domain-containing protein [Sphingomonas sp. CCH15-F11]
MTSRAATTPAADPAPPRPFENRWLTAAQIADMRLAGLPGTKRGVTYRAAEECWPFRERSGPGGGRLYCVADLPADALADYQSRFLSQARPSGTRRGRPDGTCFFDRNPHIADAILVLLEARRRPATEVLELLEAMFGGDAGPDLPAANDAGTAALPTLRTIQRFIRRAERENRVFFTAQRDPDRFKSAMRPALGRMDATVTYAHEVWEIDTTKADVLCVEGRKSILGIIDRWSRRARYQVVDSESAQSVRRILVDTIRAWGVMPARLKVDNGSGFINASIRTALETLGIELDPCLPGHPEDKPYVERLFKTFNHDRAAMLDGFAGHNVAQAQALRAAAKKRTGRAVVVPTLTAQGLQDIIDAWIDGKYHLRRHSTIGMTPMERWQSSPVPARAAPHETVLKLALSAYVGQAVVGKRGIRWRGGRYWSEALVPWMGRPVQLRRDEDDLGALFVFDDAGNYIDTVVNWERSGLSEQEYAMAARADMDRFLAAQKAEFKERRKHFSPEVARDRLLRQEAERAGKLVHLPMPSRQSPTPAMESMTARPAPQLPTQGQLDAAMAATEPKAAPPTKTDAQKVAEADAVIRAHEAGEPVDPDALRRAKLFAQSTTYRVEKILQAEFGVPATPVSTSLQQERK